ncbi:MAG: cupin fold metalloprotein, WbuC family [Bacteroidetes bacterium HGW-Bacteroidetes-9]|jgi:cupin fold WbuC family metalloprotein|nr:MAG: cupin fold metalloprotein, WbuC family [Bacteroidetes bacterium HGW-Bacteroidetes-9]
MIRINDDLLNELSAKARSSPRLRMNHNFHKGPKDRLQRMLNAMEPGTYIRPHKHENPDKREAFLALRGTLCVIEFNDLGEITDHTILSANRRNYGAEIAERSWHSVISLESGSVAYEVKDGPYNPLDDKDFAPWSPVEGSEGAESYLQQLIKQLGLSVS